jgi:hypothetical protein
MPKRRPDFRVLHPLQQGPRSPRLRSDPAVPGHHEDPRGVDPTQATMANAEFSRDTLSGAVLGSATPGGRGSSG